MVDVTAVPREFRQYRVTDPQTRSELRTFLGVCSYYRKFILRRKEVRVDELRIDAFKTLKDALTPTPVLAQPDTEGARSGAKPRRETTTFYIPIFFASKGLNKSELNYHITDLEVLAVVTALRRFRMFVSIQMFQDAPTT
ncbi:hypothetical protein COOONC_26640 [Cooperia oncophora]